MTLNMFSNRWKGDLWFWGNTALQVYKLLEMLFKIYRIIHKYIYIINNEQNGYINVVNIKQSHRGVTYIVILMQDNF